MSTGVFALLSLCLALSALGIPIDVVVYPPKSDAHRSKPVRQGVNPQLLGGGFEGDMFLPKGFNPSSQTRGTAKFGDITWPNGVIPYDISAITDVADQKKITDAMMTLMYAVATPKANTTQRAACVYFRPRVSEDAVYFNIQYGTGCSAHVGYMTNQQSQMTLQKNQGPQQNGCFYTQVIQHELLHVTGFFHEQSRPDRDNFLEIHLENVEPSMQHNFNKYAWGSTAYNQGSTYDYASIMHYGTTAFTTNGQPTMIPRKSGAEIGEALQLSPVDIAEVRHLYGCTA
jgi:hypothetical protein